MSATARETIRPNDSLLRFAMRADAVVTGLAGVAIAAAAAALSSHTGLSVTTEYVVGAVFVVFALGGLILAALPSVRWPGIGMVVANILATVAALAIVLADWLHLSTIGVVLFSASAAYTAFIGSVQYAGVRRIRA